LWIVTNCLTMPTELKPNEPDGFIVSLSNMDRETFEKKIDQVDNETVEPLLGNCQNSTKSLLNHHLQEHLYSTLTIDWS
jgi:hypothetical protein